MTQRDAPARSSEPAAGSSGEADRGRDAEHPSEIPRKGWKDILLRVWSEIDKDRIDLIAAGVAFWLLLSLFPALGATVALYGLVADPATLRDHLETLAGVVPAGGMQVIEEQLDHLVAGNERKLSLAAIVGFFLALWSTNTAMKALFAGIGVAYDEPEKRGFIRLTLVTLMFTIGALVFAIILFTAVGAVPLALALFRLPSNVEWLIVVIRWPIVLVAMVLGLAILYRYGASRRVARWRWITWGSALATLLWLVVSIGFSWYLTNFADYDRTYGSLGAVAGFMFWLWISVLVLLLGAELNAEIEHQTTVDSTINEPERPIGQRGAVMADTVGAAAEEAADADEQPHEPGPDWPDKPAPGEAGTDRPDPREPAADQPKR